MTQQESVASLLLELPLPPTINSYYQYRGFRRFVGPEGKEFKAKVAQIIGTIPVRFWDSRLALTIHLHFRDKRRQDISNRIKALEDALVQANLFDDDSQIDEEHIYRSSIIKEGRAVIEIKSLTDPQKS